MKQKNFKIILTILIGNFAMFLAMLAITINVANNKIDTIGIYQNAQIDQKQENIKLYAKDIINKFIQDNTDEDSIIKDKQKEILESFKSTNQSIRELYKTLANHSHP